MIVCKFGGSSLADAPAMCHVAEIVRSDTRRRYVVVSAPGKRDERDRKVTDLLYLCHEMARAGISFAEPFGLIRDRFRSITEELCLDLDISTLLAQVEREIGDGASAEYVASRGEYLSARVMAATLRATFVEAATCILLREEGRLDDRTLPILAERLTGGGLFVIPGFYGRDPAGRVRTFSRGGSDITGAVVAAAVGAEVYENWTDVNGLLMTDPRVVPEPRPMREVTYREIRELAYMGANVFHEEAIFPVYRRGIPINLRNTRDPQDPGTMIVAQKHVGRDVVSGIAGRTGFTLILIEKMLMNRELGFGRRLFEIFESHGVSFEHAPTGIDTMSVVVRDDYLVGRSERILEDIYRILEPDRVEIQPGLAMIATVGEGMAYRPGIAARLFAALADAGINVRVIDQGSSEINIIVGVESADYERAMNAIYRAFS